METGKKQTSVILCCLIGYTCKLDKIFSSSPKRYFVNDTFYKSGGPIFLQLGGEGTANPIWTVVGQVSTRFAPNYNALVVLLEHRYYGKSYPTR